MRKVQQALEDYIMKRLLVTVEVFLLYLNLSFAQGNYTITEEDYANTSVEMHMTMRFNGKIYGSRCCGSNGIFCRSNLHGAKTERKISCIEKRGRTSSA